MNITEQQAIDLVNADIRKNNSDPDYRVYSVKTYEWGWIMYWMPEDTKKILYGSSAYMVHRNGFMSTWNEIAWQMRDIPSLSLNPSSLFSKSNGIQELFVKKAMEHEHKGEKR